MLIAWITMNQLWKASWHITLFSSQSRMGDIRLSCRRFPAASLTAKILLRLELWQKTLLVSISVALKNTENQSLQTQHHLSAISESTLPDPPVNMPKLPVLTPNQLIKKLKKLGFTLDHTSGSHQVFFHRETGRRAVVPFHLSDLKPGTLNSLLKEAGISREELSSV